MGSTACSDPGFAVLQFLYTSQGIVHPNGTGQNSKDKPLGFFYHQQRCASTVHVVLLLGLRGCFPVPACSMCFSACSTCFYSKHQTRLAGYSDWQVAGMCLFSLDNDISIFSSLCFNGTPNLILIVWEAITHNRFSIPLTLWPSANVKAT